MVSTTLTGSRAKEHPGWQVTGGATPGRLGSGQRLTQGRWALEFDMARAFHRVAMLLHGRIQLDTRLFRHHQVVYPISASNSTIGQQIVEFRLGSYAEAASSMVWRGAFPLLHEES